MAVPVLYGHVVNLTSASAVSEPGRLRQLARLGLGTDPDAGLDQMAALVCELLDVPVALVSLVTPDQQVLPGQCGLGEQRSTPGSHSFCRTVVESEAALVVDDARADPRVQGNPAIAEFGVVAYAGHPLLDADGRVLGALCAIGHEPRTWSRRDLEVLQRLADLCSADLQQRLSRRESEWVVTRLTVLSEVTRAISSTLEPAEMVARLVRTIVPVLAQWAVVGLSDGTGRIVHDCGNGRGADDLAGEAFARHVGREGEAGGVARQVLRSSEPVLLDTPGVALCGRAGCQDLLCRARGQDDVIVVPLRGRTGNHGVLMVGSADRGVWGDAQMALDDAVDIGRRTGLVLDNAGLYQRTLGQAEQLQRQLLTKLPEPDHLHVVARYRPADEEAQIGGDWYDAFVQPDGALVAVVGDATGHDMTAAALMGQVRTLLRGIGYDTGAAPAEILHRVDAAIQGLGIDTLATCLVARMEQDAAAEDRGLRILRWSNAGHPPPVLLGPDGTVSLLEGPSELLLGVDADCARSDHTVVLAPGSVVLLYTDGLVERRREGLDRGLARLRQTVAALAGLPLEDFCDRLLERMLPDGGEDDVALLVLRAYDETRPRPVEAGPEHLPDPEVDDRG